MLYCTRWYWCGWFLLPALFLTCHISALINASTPKWSKWRNDSRGVANFCCIESLHTLASGLNSTNGGVFTSAYYLSVFLSLSLSLEVKHKATQSYINRADAVQSDAIFKLETWKLAWVVAWHFWWRNTVLQYCRFGNRCKLLNFYNESKRNI